MDLELRGVHYDIPKKVRDKIDKKMKRLTFADDLIVNMDFSFTHDKNYIIETQIHFRWGATHHIKTETYDMLKGIDSHFDKIETKVSKEKEKIQSHS